MLTPAAKRLLATRVDAAIATQKATYAERLRRLQAVFRPPLSHAELSAGLGLRAPPPGAFGGSDVGRFLSEAPSLRRARPDTETRTLVDALLAGVVFLGARVAAYGARREVTVFTEQDLRWLDSTWFVYDFGREEQVRTLSDSDLEDPDLWDPFAEVVPASSEVALRPLFGRPVHPIAMGCMRLATEDTADPTAVLHAALDAGVRVLDTADSYCRSEDDLHANERQIAEALAAWAGPAHDVVVLTKAGLSRPGGRWVPDASPERLRRSCEGSLRALGVDRLPLFQLHVVDPAAPFHVSVQTLAALKEEGLVARVGLCNVTPEQLALASDHVEVAAVQTALHPFTAQGWPLLVEAVRRGIPFLAHSPLGGHRTRGRVEAEPALAAIGKRHGVSAWAAALAMLLELAPNVFPLVGATRAASIRDSARAGGVTLGATDRATLDGRYAWLADARAALSEALPPEVVLLMGSPASGKTTRTAPYLARGYARFNRDERGGRLADLVPALDEALTAGETHAVLDNTYPTRASRKPVLDVAAKHGIPVRIERVTTSESDALVNAAQRMLERHGRLLSPEERAEAARSDPNMLPPAAIARYFATLQSPTLDEGATHLDSVPFVRRHTGRARAVLFDYDGTLRRSTGPAPYPTRPDEVELLPGRVERLAALRAEGWLLLGVSNQSGVARGVLTEDQARACFDATNALLGQDVDVRFCPHDSGEIRCWCRKPMPGMGVALIGTHQLDPRECLVVGDQDSDAAFAAHLGMTFHHADDFFR